MSEVLLLSKALITVGTVILLDIFPSMSIVILLQSHICEHLSGQSKRRWHQGLLALKEQKAFAERSWLSVSLEFVLKSLFCSEARKVQAVWNRPLRSLAPSPSVP